MTKTCVKCKVEKGLSLFSRNRSENDGLQRYCKDCVRLAYLQNRERVLQKASEYQAGRKELKKAYDKQRRLEKLEELRSYDKARNKAAHRIAKSREWQKTNTEARRVIRAKSQAKHWPSTYQKHKAAFLANAAKRRAVLQKAVPKWYSEFDDFVFEEATLLAATRTDVFGFPWEIDHIIPLRGRLATGFHCGANLQVIPREVNRWKSNKLLPTDAPHFERSS